MGSNARTYGQLTNPNAGREAGVHKYQMEFGNNMAWGENLAGALSGNAAKIRAENAHRAALNFYNREGGRITNNAYEAAEQERRMMKDKERLRFADPRSPQQLLQDRLGSEAYANRKSLKRNQADAADDIRHEAGGLLESGIKQIRQGSNSRGLLYSGMREASEGDYRGKVANTMAKNIASSNKVFSRQADSMDQIAAEAAMKGAQASAEAKARLQTLSDQEAVQRAQRMQQITGAIGYGMGSYFGNREKAPTEEPQNPRGVYTSRYSNSSY